MKRPYVLAMPCLASLLAAACAQEPARVSSWNGLPQATVMENLTDKSAAEFTTFAELLKAAGLEETLKGPGPFTVFAPTNAAFAKMPKAELESLKKPENKAKLLDRIGYHVAKGQFSADQLAAKIRIPAIQGDTIEATKTGTVFKVGNDEAMSTITHADIQASNGTIHIIDSVFEPD